MNNPNVLREVCLRTTEENFYVGISAPYSRHEIAYRRLLQLTDKGSVFDLENSGAQVFVHPRSGYDSDDSMTPHLSFSDTDLFREQVILSAQHIGNIVIDPDVGRVATKRMSQPDTKI